MSEKQVYYLNGRKEKLSGYLHFPEKQRCTCGIILSHCFTCSKHVGVIRKMCDYLAEKGFIVLRYDFAGSGESQGKFENQTYTNDIKDFSAGVNFLKKQGALHIGALGHSIGSAITILGGIPNKNVKCLVTMGGDSSTQGIEKVFDKKILNDIKTKGKCTFEIFGKKITMKKEFFDDAKKYSLSSNLKKSSKPLLIIHGDKDAIVNVDNARKLYFYANEPKDILLIKGENHMFTKNREEALLAASNWFKKYLK
jgi:uncharacterized protein